MLATQSAQAAAGTWNVDANGIWSLNTNWLNSIIADSAAANFTNNITADRTVSLDSARTISSLVFGDSNTATAGSWILNNNGNAANTLTGLSTITVNALGTGKTATISAVIAGSAPIIKGGVGTLVLSGANTLNKTDSNNASFAWRLDAGTVVVASDSAFGVSTGSSFNASTLVNLNGATLQAGGSARTVVNPLWLSNNSVVSGSESLTFSGTFSGRGGSRTLTNNITGAGTLSLTNNVYTDHASGFQTLTFDGTGNTLISGVIANNTGGVAALGKITKSGAGTLTLSNTASTYGGATTINAGVMEVAALANGGTNSSIGKSTNAAANLIFGAPTATLRYNGSSNATTDRGFTLSSGTGGGATIESSGSGTLTIDNTIALAYGTTGQTRLITLGGTNAGANTFSKVIANNGSGATSLTKAGAGQWVLGGANTYTGLTTINAGVMEVAALTNGGTASSIGQSTNAATNLVFGAPTATLRYNGSSNATTDRGFTLSSGAGGGATIESSGSGTLTIDNTVAMAYGTTNQTRLLTLGGTNTGANTFSKVIANNGSSATSLTKAGVGKWFISSTNTYTGATNVNAGTLAITGSGSINASSGVTVAAGANFVYNSSTTMTNSISLSGAGTSSRAILGGAGTIGATVTLNDLGDTLSPGNSPGIQTFTSAQTWSSFSYDWEVNNFTGTTAGTDFDQLGLNTLNLTGGAGSYILNVLSLTASNDAGNVPNFSEINNSWTILTSSGITGFDAANWSINTSGFIDPATGTWSLAQSGNNLVLSYNVIPEPNVAALIGGLGVLLILRRRR